MENNQYLSGKATAWPVDEDQAPQTVYFAPPKKKNYPARWLLLWQDESEVGVSMGEQAKMDKPLTQTEYRVRDLIMSIIGIGNMVHINQSDVGRQLRLHRNEVSKAVKRLVDLGILVKGPTSGRSKTYMVTPAFCFAGGLGRGIQARKETIQETKSKKVIPFPTKVKG